MLILQLQNASFVVPHLSSWKVLFIITTFLTLVLGLDDVIGSERTKAFAADWLSTGNSFILVLLHHVRQSATILKIVIVVCVASFAVAAIAFTAFILAFQKLEIFIPLMFLLVLAASVLGYALKAYFERTDVVFFMREHSEYLEIRILSQISAAISWAIEDTERNAFRQTPTGLPLTPYEVRMPLPTVLAVVGLVTTPVMILSFAVRTTRFLITAAIWLLAFAPAQALNAIAKRTGAENYIKVGKYILLVILSIYAIFQE
jgi:hypothetical protein